MEKYKRIALMIDAENIPSTQLNVVINDISKLGSIGYKCAYGDWTNDVLKKNKTVYNELSIVLKQQENYTKGKNAADIALVIGAMDLMQTNRFDAFAIFSSDSDYTPLVNRIKEKGLDVIGIGEEKAPKSLKNACTQYITIECLLNKSKKKPALENKNSIIIVKAKNNDTASDADTKIAHRIIRDAYTNEKNDDGWALISKVANRIKQEKPKFKISSTKCSKYISFLDKHSDIYEIKKDKNGKALPSFKIL